MANVTVTNLLQGPGQLYYRTYDAANPTEGEPENTAINAAPAASAWTNIGGTQDGMNMEVSREFSALSVDQLVDTPERRQTTRELTMATNVAEATLENFSLVHNEDPATHVTSGSGFKVYEPSDAPFIPNYFALLFDGYAPQNFRRRVIARKMLSIDPVQFAYKKDGQTLYTVKWAGHYVSDSVRPYKIVDQTS